MCDEKQAIDNKIIPPFVTGTLNHTMQNIQCLTQKIESRLQQQ